MKELYTSTIICHGTRTRTTMYQSARYKNTSDHLCEVTNLKRVAEVTIRRDLDRLTAMGNHIVKHNREHNTAYYALIDKSFSFNEIRFIVDSISINKFLTAFQKKTLS